jgi:putative aminopeptidase FrvX
MPSRATAEKWLGEITSLPTASGLEDAVVEWVTKWVARRSDLSLHTDSGGNLLLTQKGRKRRPPVVAVAHMDHPAFVVTAVEDGVISFEFRGGVKSPYFEHARIEFITGPGGWAHVSDYDPTARTGRIQARGALPHVGDIGRWRFAGRRPEPGRMLAPAMDDLAGCAAALVALDEARGESNRRHLAVLLTRAEEMGFVGAIHAAKNGTLSDNARVISVEASRASAETPMGGGPVIRVGDASSVFDSELTNAISRAAARDGIPHQRRLMSGGSCEATAFGGYGYRTAGLCLPLGNYHNMGNLDRVERARGAAIALREEISLDDFHGLVRLILLAVDAVDGKDDFTRRLDSLYDEGRHLLD